MEKYLVEQYGVIEDNNHLTDVSDIEEYFGDAARESLECGIGYYQDEVEFICKIGDKFYEVQVTAEIGSSKLENGDRFYWVEDIDSVTYQEIEKPKPKEKKEVNFKLSLTKEQEQAVIDFLKKNNISIL